MIAGAELCVASRSTFRRSARSRGSPAVPSSCQAPAARRSDAIARRLRTAGELNEVVSVRRRREVAMQANRDAIGQDTR
jgi:hypothetical protein